MTRHRKDLDGLISGDEPYFQAVASIRGVVEAHHLTMAEIALRRVSHHSWRFSSHRGFWSESQKVCYTSSPHIIFSESCSAQNLVDLEKGPLRKSFPLYYSGSLTRDAEAEDVVKALDEAWLSVKPFATKYYH